MNDSSEHLVETDNLLFFEATAALFRHVRRGFARGFTVFELFFECDTVRRPPSLPCRFDEFELMKTRFGRGGTDDGTATPLWDLV